MSNTAFAQAGEPFDIGQHQGVLRHGFCTYQVRSAKLAGLLINIAALNGQDALRET